MPRTKGFHPNLAAFMDMVAWSELGKELLAKSDDGYNVIVGSTPEKLILFTDYSHHPLAKQWIDFNHDGKQQEGETSNAAGRYQFMGRYWSAYKLQLRLPDFGPESQDRWAVHLIKECHAFDDIILGNIEMAISRCSSRWASLPGNSYGQRINSLLSLKSAYEQSGGEFA